MCAHELLIISRSVVVYVWLYDCFVMCVFVLRDCCLCVAFSSMSVYDLWYECCMLAYVVCMYCACMSLRCLYVCILM